MKVKTFSGSSLPEAIVKAKQEYGSNIILLESKEIPANRTKTGSKIVQVTVSVDPIQAPDKKVQAWTPPDVNAATKRHPKTLPADGTKKNGDKFNQVIQDILARKPKEINQEKQILQELADLREQIQQISTKPELEDDTSLPDSYNKIQENLIDKGVQEKMVNSLIKRAYQLTENGPKASDSEISSVLTKELKQLFKSYNFQKISTKKKNKVILMVGATGVGKTTTAMKLAAHQQVYGKKEVTIVSTDLYGPSEALKAFSKMNGTVVLEKRRVDELEELLEREANEVTIIDTPGQSPFAPNYLKKLEEYVKAVKPTDIFLVLPMNTDLKDLYLSAALYMLLKPSGILLTKFDETAQPGKVFSILNELNLPVAGYSTGKRIFIDFEMPKVDFVLNKLFDGNRG